MKKLRINSYLAFLVNGMLAVMTGTIITYLKSDYGITSTEAGRIVAAQSLGNMLMVLVSGFVIQILGRKKSLLLFPILFFVGFGGVAFIDNKILLYLLFALTGIGWGLCNNILNVIMIEDKEGDGINTLYTSYAVGSFLGPFFVVAITAIGMSWKVAVIAVAVMAALLIPGYVTAKVPAAPEKRISAKDFVFFKQARYYICNVLFFAYIGVEVAINSWIISFLSQTDLLDKKTAETMLSVFWLIIIFGRIFIGKFMQHYKREKLLLALWAGLSLATTALLFASNKIIAICCIVAMAIFMAGISPVNAENAEQYIKGKGISGGIIFAVGCLGSTILPMVVGSMADSWGIWSGMCVVCAVMYATILVCVINIVVKKRALL